MAARSAVRRTCAPGLATFREMDRFALVKAPVLSVYRFLFGYE